MRYLFLAIALLMTPGAAIAEESANALALSCAQATALLQRAGAVTFSTGGGDYARYVTDEAYCGPAQVTDPAWIPTADQPQCLVGARCVDQRSKSR